MRMQTNRLGYGFLVLALTTVSCTESSTGLDAGLDTDAAIPADGINIESEDSPAGSDHPDGESLPIETKEELAESWPDSYDSEDSIDPEQNRDGALEFMDEFESGDVWDGLDQSPSSPLAWLILPLDSLEAADEIAVLRLFTDGRIEDTALRLPSGQNPRAISVHPEKGEAS